MRRDAGRQLRLILLRVVEVPAQVQFHPKIRHHAKRQAQRCAWRDAALAVDDFVDMLVWGLDGVRICFGRYKAHPVLIVEVEDARRAMILERHNRFRMTARMAGTLQGDEKAPTAPTIRAPMR